MIYNFDEVIDRYHTESSKWDNVGVRVGNGDALPMWVADTDFPCAVPIVDAVKKRAEHPLFGYSYVVPDFFRVTKAWVARRYNWEIESEWIVYATGIVPVFNTMIQAFTDLGDEVIIQRPVYHPIAHAIEDNNRVISDNKLIYRNGQYSIDFEDLEKRASSEKAKIMIISSPHNPVGRVWTKEELTKIAEICLKHHVILISDEIHGDLILFGNKHYSVAALDEKYAQITVTCYAPSKTFNIAGLRASGIVVPNPDIRDGLQKQFARNRSIQQNVFALPAYIAAYTECDDYLEQLIPYLEDNIRFLTQYIHTNMPKIKVVPQEGMFLTWLDCTEMGIVGDELADFFIHEAGVAINRGDMFSPDAHNFVRINIGCPRSTLQKGLDLIRHTYSKKFD
ncbi:MalY/PatB family protein [Fusibacter ferrireducens]|uniref:cysteine-S-conjugate beta-lyase n=1 Tax=Fusibacter ferrireducens TaxID=2785058 RepID=A0ABR9ZNV4_9FIRM|nr:MalY/PatB family protein [Fusibacter ferrireducens]MBF4692114.1 pyridoxal phosphate-dependent aminotransferase [Fusibacter ferrireducens]